eukprot:m.172239 g.172239  ORF g.172239 m.172239 type:complete len:61 (+) comp9943_c2_seq6:136-318(+)
MASLALGVTHDGAEGLCDRSRVLSRNRDAPAAGQGIAQEPPANTVDVTVAQSDICSFGGP